MVLTTAKFKNASIYQRCIHILSIAMSLLILVFVFIKWNQVCETFLNLHQGWLAAGFGCYLLNYLFRGIRLNLLSVSSLSFLKEAFHFSVLHGVLSYLLPFRTGDVSLPMLLKSTGRVGFTQGTAILVKARFLDLTMLGIFAAFGSFWGARMISTKIQVMWFFTGILLAFSFCIFQKIGWMGRYIIQKKFKTELDINWIFRFNIFEFLITFFIWLGMYATQYCMVSSIGLDLSLSEVVFISAIQFPLQLFPVQGLGNAGNHEGGWISASILMGFSSELALEYALASHGVLLAYVMGLGILPLVTSLLNKKKNHEDSCGG